VSASFLLARASLRRAFSSRSLRFSATGSEKSPFSHRARCAAFASSAFFSRSRATSFA
jgi:hypothetical protein